MIIISKDHKELIESLLTQKISIDTKIDKIKPVLKTYYKADFTKIGKRLLAKLVGSWRGKSNEAIIHYWTVCKLIFEYGYPANHIDLEVACGNLGRKALDANTGSTLADIVVYAHDTRRAETALVVIECREFGGQNGAKQAASYSRALQSRYHLFTDSDKWEAFETQPHPIDGISISDIPHWVGYKPLAKRLSKSNILPPITDEKQLRDLVGICHDSIHSEGVDPAKAFDELVKLFFVKVYDEQEIPNVYEFSVLAGENADDTGNHIRQLLKQAKEKSKYKQLFSQPGDDEFSVSNKSIRKVVETFQGFSFAGNSLIGIDAKGTVYENMVGSTFRGELGQYFTPRKIVEFMVDFLDPTKDDKVLDPSCGSGGFLIYVLRKVAASIRNSQAHLPQHKIELLIKSFVDNQIFGADISPRMVRAARMNMIMHGDGWSGVQRCHGLEIHENTAYKTSDRKFSLILSNPPFAGFETDETLLTKFEVGKNASNQTRGVNRALIFVEQIINLLEEGGRTGLVIPRSIFENESYSFKKLREIIFANCEILSIIGLPKTAFHHTDCGILGDLLLLKKTSTPRNDYLVYINYANNVGYNTLGHNLEDDDFKNIIEAYQNNNPANFVSIKKLITNDNINPWFYHPNAEKLRQRIQKNQSNLLPLTDLISVYNVRISRRNLRQTPNRTLKYVQVRDFDPQTGDFSYKEHKISALPSRATYELNGEELILLPNARNSLESKRQIIKVGEETKGLIMTNRFLPLRARVNPVFLVMMLNSDFVRNQMIAVCRGAGAPDFREGKLSEIMIPVPDSEDLSTIDSFMEDIMDKLARRKQLEKELKNINDDMNSQLQKLIE